MTKTELEEIFHLRKEIIDIDNRIERLEKQSEIVADTVQNGYKHRAVIKGVDIKRKYKLDNCYDLYNEFQEKIKSKEREIEKYIECVPFSEIRQILRHRYIDGMNWVQVAHKMNERYSKKEYTDSSVRQKHDRFLEKN